MFGFGKTKEVVKVETESKELAKLNETIKQEFQLIKTELDNLKKSVAGLEPREKIVQRTQYVGKGGYVKHFRDLGELKDCRTTTDLCKFFSLSMPVQFIHSKKLNGEGKCWIRKTKKGWRPYAAHRDKFYIKKHTSGQTTLWYTAKGLKAFQKLVDNKYLY